MVLADIRTRRHPLRCLFFVGAIVAAQAADARTSPASDCLAGTDSQAVRIVEITDGDSLLVDDGRRLRLIGINALEMHSPDAQERRLARTARDTLQGFLHEPAVLLIPGLETQDAYGRTLAHIRLSDGRDAGRTLVAKGLALAVAVGANTRCADRLQSLERRARRQRLGLWQLPEHPLTKEKLSGQEHGFHLITGQVLDISGRGARTTLHLNNGLQVMLGRHWPVHGNTHSVVPERLAGSKVQVRGWLNTVNGQQRMTLHHPGNLELISN